LLTVTFLVNREYIGSEEAMNIPAGGYIQGIS
jgi:hypothetical protein